MSITEKQIRELIKANQGGSFEECHGPSAIGPLQIWEVWVYRSKPDEYDVRYAVVDSGTLVYLDGFPSLCGYVSRYCDATTAQLKLQNEKLERDLASLDDTRLAKRLTLAVGATVFVSSVAVLLILLLRYPTYDPKILYLVGGVVASGAVLFLGSFRPMPNWFLWHRG